MNKKNAETVTMSVDLKKYGIRIHKTLYRLIGEPKYIQLLVNPDEMIVAIRGVDKSVPKDSTHKINVKRMYSEASYEIYSRFFVCKLCEVVGDIKEGYSYRLSGEVLPSQGMAVFSLKTLYRIER